MHFPLAVPAQQREIALSRRQDHFLATSGSRRMEVIRSYLAAANRNDTSLCGGRLVDAVNDHARVLAFRLHVGIVSSALFDPSMLCATSPGSPPSLRFHIAGTFINNMQFSMSWFALDRV